MAVVGTAKRMLIDRDGRRGENGLREYSELWRVITDSASDDENIVLLATGLPAAYDPWASGSSTDSSAKVVERQARRDPRLPTLWRVQVIYSTQYDRIQTGPFDEPPDVEYDSETWEEPLPGMPKLTFGTNDEGDQVEDLVSSKPFNNQELTHWTGGKGIVNSAGFPYNPPPTQPATRPIVIYTRNEADFTPQKKLLYENTVNSSAWSGLTKRQAWLRKIRAYAHVWKSSTFSQQDVYYHRVSYEFVLKAETWDLQLLDYGPFYLTWSGGGVDAQEEPTITSFTTNDGQPRMGLLDNSDPNKPGRKLANGEAPQWRRYPTKRQIAFQGLNINLQLSLEDIRTTVRGG